MILLKIAIFVFDLVLNKCNSTLTTAFFQVMEIINAPSRQRGRVIDFNELLYGYIRLQPLHGVDYVLDLLLKYRRYRGRKMTAAVRRHAYLQQSFTGKVCRA